MKLAASGLSTSDQNSFLEEARTILKGAEPETHWFEVAFEMLVDKALLVNKEALQEIDRLQLAGDQKNGRGHKSQSTCAIAHGVPEVGSGCKILN